MHDMYHSNNYYQQSSEDDYMNKSGTDNQSEEDLDHHMHYSIFIKNTNYY